MVKSESIPKDILVQYCDLKEEIKDIRKRVQKLKDDIVKIEQEGSVIDCVKGGYGGIQNFKIQGFPYPEYTKKRTALMTRTAILTDMEMELLELTNKVEEYIQGIDDSRIRRILRFRYVDDMTWVQVAINMGGRTTEESVRKEHERFLAKEHVCP